MKRLLLIVALALVACGPASEGPALTAAPSHGSMFGQYQVTLSGEVAALGAVRDVKVGGIEAYAVHATSKSITVTLQGAPRPGPVDVEVTGSRAHSLQRGLFTFDAPAQGVPITWMAFGASLTQGTQSGGIDPHSQLWGYAAQLAKAAGVFLALPLFQPTFVPPVQPTDLDADCHAPAHDSTLASMTATITDPETGMTNLALGRLDPTLVPRDVAIGGETVDFILHGGRGVLALLEHVVEDPETTSQDDIITPEAKSQIDRLEALDPAVGVSADVLANDLDKSVTQSDDLHPEAVTPLAQLQPLLVQMMQRLGKLHGQYFIANMPSLTFLPNVTRLHDQLVGSGAETEEAFAAKVKQIDDLTDADDAALAAAMAPYPNLHLVDFKGAVDKLRGGLEVNGEHLTVQAFGGLLSLDGLHFTDTGSAVLANVFIDAMNPVLKSRIAPVDLAAVEKQDALSPAHLRALGLRCVP